MDLSVSNSFILMNESPDHQQLDERGRNKRTMLFFRQQLAKQLMSGYREGRKRKRSVHPGVSGAGHWPLKLEKKKDCVKPGCTGESRFICTGCSDLQRKKYAHMSVQRRNCSKHKLMTRPKFVNMYDAAKTSRKVGKTIMIYTMFLMTIFFK